MKSVAKNLLAAFGFFAIAFAGLCTISRAQDPRIAEAAKMEPAFTAPLWPSTPPGETQDLGKELLEVGKENPPVSRMHRVSMPTLAFYPAPAKDSEDADQAKPCVIVLPGGGYSILAYDLEGTEVVHWLNSNDFSAFLCKYRVPRRTGQPKHLAPLQDVQRAVRLVRQNAKKWNVDPEKIGVLGFSAGGHLCVMAATAFEEKTYEPIDEADKLSCRPDFALPIYPAYLLGEDGRTNNVSTTPFSAEVKITKDTPPFFMSIADDDPVGAMGAARTYVAMRDLGVPCELHIFVKGGHGYGLRHNGNRAATWDDLAAGWLKTFVDK